MMVALVCGVSASSGFFFYNAQRAGLLLNKPTFGARNCTVKNWLEAAKCVILSVHYSWYLSPKKLSWKFLILRVNSAHPSVAEFCTV
jgi:hypothetical protein